MPKRLNNIFRRLNSKEHYSEKEQFRIVSTKNSVYGIKAARAHIEHVTSANLFAGIEGDAYRGVVNENGSYLLSRVAGHVHSFPIVLCDHSTVHKIKEAYKLINAGVTEDLS